ncbi:copper resistance protein CopC [Paeniroseomonas aquatica]|uniref:Copper resistance protein CopC n=1 Tax=Paeniroseomonas aquatica TaxID=373043 RepID=A0ABT8A327_9PROT|nr:copper resistance protein CopC [Paeniroseomonas aquatica]MDN3564110.1 copper resistance protein CopC [Paeniroseomonas aquatica]
MTAFLSLRRGVAAFAVAVGLATSGAALAHSDVHHSEPAEGAVLRASPPAVVLQFPAPVRVMTLRLLDEAGREKRLAREGERSAAVQEVRATVQDRLAPGAYRVEWRGASPDGHVGSGTVNFSVAPAGR